MHRIQLLTLSGLLLCILSGAVEAQSRALAVFGYAGRDLPLSNLNEEGDHFRADWMAGGGAALQLSTNFAIRGSFSAVKSSWEGTSLELSDSTFKRTFVSFDLQAGAPLVSGFVPYFIAGAGWVKIDPQDAEIEKFTKVAAHLGTGINYVIDNSFLALMLELDTWVYHVGGLGYNRIQYDIVIVAGLAIAVPL